MKILSIDTSSTICSVSILEDYNVIKEISVIDEKTHSQNLMPIIKEILEQTNLHLSDIDLLACNKGPGSFTGVRIGISTIKGLATPTDKPVCGINALRGLAYNIKVEGSTICTLIDAKNNNVYFGLFKLENSNYILLEKYDALPISEVITILSKYENILFTGTGAIVHKELLQENFKNCTFASNEQNLANSVSIGQAAYDKFKVGDIQNSDSISPLYLRKSQAERLFNKEV